jgi:hypothetical protein
MWISEEKLIILLRSANLMLLFNIEKTFFFICLLIKLRFTMCCEYAPTESLGLPRVTRSRVIGLLENRLCV